MPGHTGSSPIGASFQRLAGGAAMFVGAGALAYAIVFVAILGGVESNAAVLLLNGFLTLGGILSTAVLVAVYLRLRDTDEAFALWGLLLGTVAFVGSAVAGAYRVANVVEPPASINADLPSAADPRGFLTFAVSALALLILSRLIVAGGGFPKRLGYLGYVAAALLLLVYLGRLIILDPKDPLVLTAAVASGFVVNPAWFMWLGFELWRGGRP